MDLIRETRRSGVPIRVSPNREHSLKTLVSESRSIADELATPGLLVTVDVSANGLRMTVPDDARAPLGPQRIEQAIERSRGRAAPGLHVAVDSGPGVVSDHIRGGADIQGDCTTGFSGYHSITNSVGFLTAGHCVPYVGNTTTTSDYFHTNVSATLVNSQVGWSGDIAFYSSGDTPSSQYFPYGPYNSTRWNVNSTVSQWDYAVGDSYCAYSAPNGARLCRQVVSGYASWSDEDTGATVTGFLMGGDIVTGGYSGGHWSYSGKAAGLHSSSAWFNGGPVEAVTKISAAWSTLQVTVSVAY